MSAESSSAAAALGRMARGVPKRFSEEERTLRRERLAAVRAKRWKKKPCKGKDAAETPQ